MLIEAGNLRDELWEKLKTALEDSEKAKRDYKMTHDEWADKLNKKLDEAFEAGKKSVGPEVTGPTLEKRMMIRQEIQDREIRLALIRVCGQVISASLQIDMSRVVGATLSLLMNAAKLLDKEIEMAMNPVIDFSAVPTKPPYGNERK